MSEDSFFYGRTEEQLITDLTAKFIPILARLAWQRDNTAPPPINDSVSVTMVVEPAVSDLPELDVEKFEPRARNLVSRWLRLLENAFGQGGVTIGQVDDRLLPKAVRRHDIDMSFEGIGLDYPRTAVTDSELVVAALRYFKLVYCPDRDLPPEMLRLLEIHYVAVDCCL